MAAANPDARRSLMESLVELHPRGVSQADHLGKLPLHLACEAGKFWDKGVRAIYDAVDLRGRYALHWACTSSKSWEGGLKSILFQLLRAEQCILSARY